MNSMAKRLSQAAGLTILLLLGLRAAPVLAQVPCDASLDRLDDIQNHRQLKNFVYCAQAHVAAVGWDAAVSEFLTQPEWVDGSMYLFAGDMDGRVQFTAGDYIEPGTDRSQLQDSTGYRVIENMLHVVDTYGEGYVYYQFPNPATGMDEPKIAFAAGLDVDGEPLFLGAGFYPRAVSSTCHPDQVRASLVYTEEELERFVRCAELHLIRHGAAAFFDFHTDERWKSGPTYLFMNETVTSNSIASGGNPYLLGGDLADWTDSDGRRIMDDIGRVVEHWDEGYAYYRFRNPATDREEAKASFVKKVTFNGMSDAIAAWCAVAGCKWSQGREYILGAGLYVPVSPQCRNVPAARDVDTADELELFVTCAKEMVEERGATAFDLLTRHPQWIGGSTYIYVMDNACRSILYPLDYLADNDDCDLEDAAGNRPNELILDVASSHAGRGWVEYEWMNPAAGEVQTKSGYVMGIMLNGVLHAIGSGLYLDE